MYLIRFLENGQMATVTATTARGALRKYVEEKNPPSGLYHIKERGADVDWQEYSIA